MRTIYKIVTDPGFDNISETSSMKATILSVIDIRNLNAVIMTLLQIRFYLYNHDTVTDMGRLCLRDQAFEG